MREGVGEEAELQQQGSLGAMEERELIQLLISLYSLP
jgi:hypothetical protein